MTVTPRAGLKTLHHRSDWNTSRLKFIFKRETRMVSENDEVITAFRDGTVTLRKNRREDGFTFAEKEIGYQGIEPDDLVIHAMDGFAGAIGVSDSRGKGSPVLTIATPISDAFPRYWGYYLRSLAISGFIQSLAKGIRERSTDFRWKDASNLLVNHPDLATQRRIADFLDRETARIDLLIEKKQRLGEVLNSTHSAATLRVLNDGYSEQIYDSSSNRLIFHEMREGWHRVRVKHIVSHMTSGSRGWSDLISDKGELFLQSGCITRKMGVSLNDAPRIAPQEGAEAVRTRVNQFDTLVCITGGRTGAVGFIESSPEPAYINQHVCLLRPNKKRIYPRLLAQMLFSEIGQIQFQMAQYGLKQGLGFGEVANVAVPLPPREIQETISKEITLASERLDLASRGVNTSITRLKEYRSALITAAVTGQIDVETYAQSGTTDRRIDALEQEATA